MAAIQQVDDNDPSGFASLWIKRGINVNQRFALLDSKEGGFTVMEYVADDSKVTHLLRE